MQGQTATATFANRASYTTDASTITLSDQESDSTIEIAGLARAPNARSCAMRKSGPQSTKT